MLDNPVQSRMAVSRIEWIDLAKGITILLVIIGHTVSEGFYEQVLRGLIFSFHMPLFFILSCATYKLSESKEKFIEKSRKAAQYLLTPALFTFAIGILIQCMRTPELCIGGLEFWKGKLFTLLFASGVSLSYNGFEVAGLGIPWFFFALFMGRMVFDYAHLVLEDEAKVFLCCCLLGMTGILFGKTQWMPFSMDIAIAIMPFFYFGYCMKKMSVAEHPFRKFLIWSVVWIGTLLLSFTSGWTYMELAVRRYTLFPICYLTAIAGTMAVCEMSVILCRVKNLIKPLIFFGKNSMYLLCVHILDGYWSSIWWVNGNQFLSAARRVVIDLAIFFLVMLIRYYGMYFSKNRMK